MISAVENGNENALKLLLQPVAEMMNEKGQEWPSLLTTAVRRGREGIAKLLLGAGAEKHVDHLTSALGIAAKEGRKIVFSLLLEHGADINAGDKMLHWAAEEGEASVVWLVLSQTKKRDSRPRSMGSVLFTKHQ